jgi:ParB-like nuclease domain
MDKRVQKVPTHPAAEAYRLMDEAELEELAVSIAGHGLRDPITVGVIGAQRWIIDGRNREKACEIAGVAPEYEEIEFANETALRAFVADRNERRNITKSQKAMAHAILFPEAPTAAERGAMGGKGNKAVEKNNSFDKSQLSQARAILAHSSGLAGQVRDGTKTLTAALEQVEREQRQADDDGTRLAQLRKRAPDLAEQVDQEKLTLIEAEAAADARERAARDRAARDRDTYHRGVTGTVSALLWWNERTIGALTALMAEDEEFALMVRRSLEGGVPYHDRLLEAFRLFFEFIKEEFPG